MPAHRDADLYERELGPDARARQERERGERHPCCGQLVSDGHHIACASRPADDPPPVIEGQEALL